MLTHQEQTRGVVLKKKWGTPETRLRQRFTVTQNINSAVLKISYTAFQSSFNSGLTFARISVQKKWGSGGRVPLSKKVGDVVSPRPRPWSRCAFAFQAASHAKLRCGLGPIGNESAPMQLAQCRFPELVISNIGNGLWKWKWNSLDLMLRC